MTNFVQYTKGVDKTIDFVLSRRISFDNRHLALGILGK